MRSREAFFDCTYVAGPERYTLKVRAWTAADAESIFREELESLGVDAPGLLLVVGPRGAGSRRSTYTPRRALETVP
ncbi:MAG TPA: hypothetical protein VMT17_04415 [Anaeromyxobacteraceae bacterium]|nr:hypothetical protein [Anaeromyxobacteraceae bacterium]